jgi:Phage P22-like portal protein
MLTINQLPTFVNQVTNDIRQNRPAIHYSPTGDRADRETAKMLDGMVRQIWRESVGDIALDTAIDNAAGAPGWGYIRVLNEYEAPDSFNQKITIGRIVNPFSVYPDPRCTSPTGQGMKWCFVVEYMDRDDFKEKHPQR